MNEFNLCDEAWIQVRFRAGGVGEVSLRDVFKRSDEIAAIAGDGPTQDAAILRLLLAIMIRAGRPRGIAFDSGTWSEWWESGLPLEAIEDYLNHFRGRFDLRHPEMPFLQVAGLHTASGNRSGLSKIIPDLPDGHAFFTQRAGEGRTFLKAPEAARWTVHCHAFDVNGIKSGAVGDERVKGGRGYPIGIGWTGWLGLVVIEGDSLAQTLLLNLPMDEPEADDDQPVWERLPLTSGVEVGHPAPLGTADLYTWPTRRLLLVWDGDVVTDVQVSNGDPISPQNRHRLEPMSGWRRSPAQEKKLGGTVFMPRPHDPSRQVWRGLAALIDSRGEGSRRPRTMEWLATMSERDVIDREGLWRLHITGITYGSNQSVIATVIDDVMDAPVAALVDDIIIQTALSALQEADEAVQALANLAADLADATNSNSATSRARGRERGYSSLDSLYRAWFAQLGPGRDLENARLVWAQAAYRVIRAEGELLEAEVGQGGFQGRVVSRPGRKEQHMDAGRAWMYFMSALRDALSLANGQVKEGVV